MESTTLVTFLLKSPIRAASIELLGSWDNFSKPYQMQSDGRRGASHWSGCYRFENIVCDGETARLSEKRSGGLKMGGTYWYYYRLNGDDDYCDPTEPHTTACPLLPGQDVNVLDVPVERVDDSIPFAGSDLSWSSVARTLDPQDKFLAPRSAPLPPTRRPSTASYEATEELKSLMPPLTRLSTETTIPCENGEDLDDKLQNQCTAYEHNDMCANSAIEIALSPVETSMKARSFAMAKSRSCPEVLLCTQDETMDPQAGTLEISITEDYRPTTSYRGSRELHLGLSSLQLHAGPSSSANTGHRSSLPEVAGNLRKSMMQSPPLTESDQSIFRFKSWPEDKQGNRVPYSPSREHQSGLMTDTKLGDARPLISRRSHLSEDSDFAMIMLEADNPPSPYDTKQDHSDIVESAHSIVVKCHETSTMIPRLIDFPAPRCSTGTVQPPSPPRAQPLRLERPGLLRSKFSEWSVTSVDAPQSASGPAPEVEDLQSPTLSAVSYSSDEIITPRKQSEQDAEYVEQIMTSKGSVGSDEYFWTTKGSERERSYETDFGFSDIVTGLQLADETYRLRYDTWHTADAS